VYKARLHTGEVVAVKVQRPEALSMVSRDLCILKRGSTYYQVAFRRVLTILMCGQNILRSDLKTG
jgi:predicted unusual protein kinase regulating ubiquinone biosynthesis (AarF/ABC1/UbiB family)